VRMRIALDLPLIIKFPISLKIRKFDYFSSDGNFCNCFENVLQNET
jgi:hypothetical protein